MVCRLVISIIITLNLTIATMSGLAQVYEWVDQDGQRHFSDQPPEESIASETRSYEIRNFDTSMPAPVVAAPSASRQDNQQAAARQAHRDRQCQEAREYLSTIKGRVRFVDEETGEAVYMSEADRRAKVEEVSALIQRKC